MLKWEIPVFLASSLQKNYTTFGYKTPIFSICKGRFAKSGLNGIELFGFLVLYRYLFQARIYFKNGLMVPCEVLGPKDILQGLKGLRHQGIDIQYYQFPEDTKILRFALELVSLDTPAL